eukprot:16949-Hanusia_phi.AAC.1
MIGHRNHPAGRPGSEPESVPSHVGQAPGPAAGGGPAAGLGPRHHAAVPRAPPPADRDPISVPY